jgi:hypothetical protein
MNPLKLKIILKGFVILRVQCNGMILYFPGTTTTIKMSGSSISQQFPSFTIAIDLLPPDCLLATINKLSVTRVLLFLQLM